MQDVTKEEHLEAVKDAVVDCFSEILDWKKEMIQMIENELMKGEPPPKEEGKGSKAPGENNE
jgi:hypothetical protein